MCTEKLITESRGFRGCCGFQCKHAFASRLSFAMTGTKRVWGVTDFLKHVTLPRKFFVNSPLPDQPLSRFPIPILSFLGLSRFFRDFPELSPICPFPFSRPIDSTYKEQSRVRDTIRTFPPKVGNQPVGKLPKFAFSKSLHVILHILVLSKAQLGEPFLGILFFFFLFFFLFFIFHLLFRETGTEESKKNKAGT